MLELLAIGGSGFLAVSMITDIMHDGGPAGLMTALSHRLGRRVDVVAPAETPKVKAWLREHAGTTDLSQADVAFFKEQLRLAYQDMGRDA